MEQQHAAIEERRYAAHPEADVHRRAESTHHDAAELHRRAADVHDRAAEVFDAHDDPSISDTEAIRIEGEAIRELRREHDER